MSTVTERVDAGPLLAGYVQAGLALDRAQRTLAHPDSSALIEENGLVCWRFLPWDSAQFGFPAARLEFLLARQDAALRSLLNTALEQARERGIRHMIARLDVHDLPAIHALEASGFELIDGIQTYALTLDCASHRLNSVPSQPQARATGSLCKSVADGDTAGSRPRPFSRVQRVVYSPEGSSPSRSGCLFCEGLASGFLQSPRKPGGTDFSLCTRLFQEQDLPQILQIAGSSYSHDRFHADETLDSETADRIHREWLRNSCNGTMADAVIVAVRGDLVLGYVTCKLDREALSGSIEMVATTSGERGRGVAMSCTLAALDWFRSQNTQVVEVGTQLRNIAASRLYEKCGFRLVSNSLTLRKVF